MKPIIFCLFLVFIYSLFSCESKTINNNAAIEEARSAIEHILQIQETAYDQRNDPDRLNKFQATCADSMLFIGGEDGGLSVTATAYVHDLADGYTIKPHDRTIHFFGNTAIATSLHQGFKLLGKDTLFLNVRSSKVFTKESNAWKMIYTTNALVPVLYEKIVTPDISTFASYTGLYKSATTATDTILADQGKLYVASQNTPRSALKPINDSTFVGDGYFGKTGFSKGANGKIDRYYFEWLDGQRIYFAKIK